MFDNYRAQCGMIRIPQYHTTGQTVALTEDGVRGSDYATPRQLSSRPTAILCSNDLMAIGVMRQAYEHRIPIPSSFRLSASTIFGFIPQSGAWR